MSTARSTQHPVPTTPNMPLWIFFVLVLATGLSACFRNPAPTHFYLLNATATKAPATFLQGPEEQPLIGVGPVRIPAYLDRLQIVTALSDQEYKIADYDRWAERLDDAIRRVLGENLSILIPTERIVFYPWPARQIPAAKIAVDVQQLHANAEGQVRLLALWTLEHGTTEPEQRKFVCRRPAPANDYSRITAAESACLGEFSRSIADTIRSRAPGTAAPSR